MTELSDSPNCLSPHGVDIWDVVADALFSTWSRETPSQYQPGQEGAIYRCEDVRLAVKMPMCLSRVLEPRFRVFSEHTALMRSTLEEKVGRTVSNVLT